MYETLLSWQKKNISYRTWKYHKNFIYKRAMRKHQTYKITLCVLFTNMFTYFLLLEHIFLVSNSCLFIQRWYYISKKCVYVYLGKNKSFQWKQQFCEKLSKRVCRQQRWWWWYNYHKVKCIKNMNGIMLNGIFLYVYVLSSYEIMENVIQTWVSEKIDLISVFNWNVIIWYYASL